jgi:hypothetical protein
METTRDTELPLNGREKSNRVDLGLAISRALLQPGERRTQEELAAFCGCTRGGIFMMEKAALQKLKKRLFLRNDPVLKEMVSQVIGRTLS